MSGFSLCCLLLGAFVLPLSISGFGFEDNILIRPGPGWVGSAFQPTIFAKPVQNPGWGWGQQQKPQVVSFFQNRYCQGGETVISVGSGECINLPREVCDWNLSLKTYGACVEVFEQAGCAVHPRRNFGSGYGFLNGGRTGSKIFRANVCQSTKLNGFDVVRSFRRCNC